MAVSDKIRLSRLVAGLTNNAGKLIIHTPGYPVKTAKAEAAPMNPLVGTEHPLLSYRLTRQDQLPAGWTFSRKSGRPYLHWSPPGGGRVGGKEYHHAPK